MVSTLAFTSLLGWAGVQTQNKQKVNVLFFQNADEGRLIPIKEKPGYYQLVLKGVNDNVNYFTDRPNRKAGVYPTAKFIKQWQEGRKSVSFNKIPPNAALSAIETHLLKHKMFNRVFELSAPQYDEKNHTLTYIARTVDNDSNQLPAKFKHPALFIDNYCASCVGGGF